MAILVLVVVLTIFISSQCSLYEAILYSTRMGALEAEKTEGKRKGLARRLIDMKTKISIPLSAILILNTISNTAGATIAGMYAHKTIGQQWVPVFSVLFTLGILFFAEIIPKTIGAVYWRSFWPTIVLPLTIMKYFLYPLIIITQWFSESITRRASVPPITEEDILGTIRLGAKDGEISQMESHMLHNIINLETKKVSDVMTPRTVMFTLDETMSVEEALRIASDMGFTRIPTYRGDRENIVGYIMLHDLTSANVLSEPKEPISTIAKPIRFVRQSENCLSLLTTFLKKRRHIAVIGDDFGGVAGLITLEDLLETVLGEEIVDETDSIVDLQKHARKRMLKRFETERTETAAEGGAVIEATEDIPLDSSYESESVEIRTENDPIDLSKSNKE
jgi:CBS domain containing-hemolysin-like protein